MANLGLSTTWPTQDWSTTLIEALVAEAAVLQAPNINRVDVRGRTGHFPRLLVDPAADWVAELAELPTDPGSADVLALTPRKVGCVVALSRESIEDASVNELDAVGRSLVRGVAKKVDANFFSNTAATATVPAGVRSYMLPGSAMPSPDVPGILDGIGAIQAVGGNADVAFLNSTDLTALRKAVVAGGYSISDPTAPGVEAVGGARLVAAPLTAGTCLVCDSRFILFGVRRDAAVDFSNESLFSKDAVQARVTMRIDWAPSDLNAFYVIT